MKLPFWLRLPWNRAERAKRHTIMAASNYIIILNSVALLLCVLGSLACISAIYVSYNLRSEEERRLTLMQSAAVEIERGRREEAAAKRELRELQAEIDRARTLSMDLQRQLDSARTEQPDAALSELPRSAVPRILSADDRRKIVTFLKAYTNRMSLTVTMLDEQEPSNYGMQIVDALTAAGVRVQAARIRSFSVTNAPDEALYGVRYTSGCPDPVRRSLENAGLNPQPAFVTPNRSDLYIGLNPARP